MPGPGLLRPNTRRSVGAQRGSSGMVSQEIPLRPYRYDAIHECHTNTRMPDGAHSCIRDHYSRMASWAAPTVIPDHLTTLLPNHLITQLSAPNLLTIGR
jgi:hypothetical protein